MINSHLLQYLHDIVCVCEKIDSAIVKLPSKDSSDRDFFVYHFFHRSFLFGKGIILLVNNLLFHEATLVARNMLEGLFYFEAYKMDPSLATKWRLYSLYEDYQKAVRDEGKEIADKLLADWKKKLGEEEIEEAKSEFDFDKRNQRWHQEQKIKDLVKDTDLKELYNVLYSDFSQVTHWTPTGVVGGQLSVNAALAVSFQCLYTMSKYINDNYQLRFGDDLKRIVNRYIQHHSSALNLSQEVQWSRKQKSD